MTPRIIATRPPRIDPRIILACAVCVGIGMVLGVAFCRWEAW